jgi:glycerol-3-phosphate acyltransferase PlsX
VPGVRIDARIAAADNRPGAIEMNPAPRLDKVRLAIDCMGGDHGPSVTLPACRSFLAAHPEVEIVLVGQADALAPAAGWARCSSVVASEVVAMDDPLEVALRRKKDSSMRVAINQVKPDASGTSFAQACVSAGNTAALMAVSRYVLKTLDGIDRPAIAAVLPNKLGRYTTMLDLGANVDCTAEHLLQFAVMGSALVSAVDGTDNPSVALLNIGEEEIKGNDAIKKAGELLRAVAAAGHMNFLGNVEGNDIFKGGVDVVICDGFVGNVALKTSEGVASLIVHFLRQEFMRNALTRVAGAVARPVLKRLVGRLDHRRYSGGALLGLRGLVFKAHGSSDAYAFEQALNRAYDAARNGLLERVHDRILETLQALPAAVNDEDLTAPAAVSPA